MKKNKKIGFLGFKCSPDLQKNVEHTADKLNIGVSVLMRDITTRAVAGYMGRIEKGLPINAFNNGRQDSEPKQDAACTRLDSEYKIYLACADDGKGGDITQGGAPLKTFDEWLNS